MARIRDPNRDKAKELYLASKGEITNRAIAEQLDIDEKKVAVWKSRDKWNVVQQTDNNKKNVVQQKPKGKKQQKSDVTSKANVPVIENDDLTDKQRLFIGYYLKYWNATKAYQKAYNSSYPVANVEGPRLLVNPSVRIEIVKARDEVFSESLLSTKAIIQKYMDIAFADITDFMEFGSREEPYLDDKGNALLDPETGEPLTYRRNFVYFNNSDQVDGTIISEVKQGKDGASIKLADRMRALDKLDKYMGLMSEEERLKVKKLKGEIALLEQKAVKDDDKPIEIVITRKGERS